MGFEDGVEPFFGGPCRRTDGRFKRTYELTSSIVPRGTSFHHAVELEFPPLVRHCFHAASLIGRLGSSAFRLSNVAVSMSLAGSRLSIEPAPRPFHQGV